MARAARRDRRSLSSRLWANRVQTGRKRKPAVVWVGGERKAAGRAGPAERATAFVALCLAVEALGVSFVFGLEALSRDPDGDADTQTVLILEGFALAQIAVVGYAIWALVRIFRGGKRTLWWQAGVAYGLGAALTFVVWLLWARDFSGG